MTTRSDTLQLADETGAAETPSSVRAIRSFVRGRRRRSWLDLYAIGFAIVIACIYLSDLLTAPLSRLSGAAAQAAGQASGQAASQAVAGTALVIAIAAGLLMLAQAFGPIALSPTDSFWLLLSPLDRRALLRRPTATVAGLGALAGVAAGVLALAMAGPYLQHRSRALPAAWLALSAVSGAGIFLAIVFVGALAQPRPRWRTRLRMCCAAVAAIAVVGAVAGERWGALAHAITAGFARTSTGALGVLAAVSVALAAVVGALVWLSLRRFPAGVLRTDSARAGRASGCPRLSRSATARSGTPPPAGPGPLGPSRSAARQRGSPAAIARRARRPRRRGRPRRLRARPALRSTSGRTRR